MYWFLINDLVWMIAKCQDGLVVHTTTRNTIELSSQSTAALFF